jgi:hypothetical protein
MESKKKLKTWHWILIVLGGLVILGMIFGGSDSSDTNPSNEKSLSGTKTISSEKLVILSHELDYSDYGNLVVKGIAKNVAGRDLDYCQLDVKFYDSDNSVIGTSLANIDNLDEGESWKFEAMYFDLDTYNVKSYKIEVGSCW